MSNAEVDKKLRDRFFRHTWQRIRGGFDTSAVSRLLVEIQSSIKHIADFTAGSTAVAPKRVALQKRTHARYWLRNRDYARRVFECLHSHWSCACPRQHCASLRLDIGPNPTMCEEKETNFNVLLSYDAKLTTGSAACLPWSWREVDIQLVPVRKQ